MSVKKIKTTARLSVMEEWTAKNLNHYCIDYGVDEHGTQTVITKSPLTLDIAEPTRQLGSVVSDDKTKILTGTPFWNIINSLLESENKNIELNIFVSHNRENQADEDIEKYHLEIFEKETQNMRVYLVVENRKKRMTRGLHEGDSHIPLTSGWWFLIYHALKNYWDVQNYGSGD